MPGAGARVRAADGSIREIRGNAGYRQGRWKRFICIVTKAARRTLPGALIYYAQGMPKINMVCLDFLWYTEILYDSCYRNSQAKEERFINFGPFFPFGQRGGIGCCV